MAILLNLVHCAPRTPALYSGNVPPPGEQYCSTNAALVSRYSQVSQPSVTMETADKMDSKAKVDLSWPRAQEAREYLMNHKVMELLNNMTAQLIYHRPGG